MADQGFSSPGEHMASGGSSGSSGRTSSGVIYSPGSQYGPGYSDAVNVINAPYHNNYDDSTDEREYNKINYNNLNSLFDNFLMSRGGYGSTAKDYADAMRGVLKEYQDYNDSLFNRAKEYDTYMSNTAIQRQVKDLVAAGLNPILASHLGGATYKGVNAPYISISPSGTLQAFTQNEASHYATDIGSMTNLEITRLQTSSNEFISQYNKFMERVITGDKIQADKDLVDLKKSADAYLENLKHANQLTLQNAGFDNQKDLQVYQNTLNKNYFDYINGLAGNYDINNFVNALSRLIPGARGIFMQ